MKSIKFSSTSLLLISYILINSCTGNCHKEDKKSCTSAKTTEVQIEKAICMLYPTKDSKVSGTITFAKVESGIKVIAEIKGLTPGKHGFHIHNCGDCTAADGSSTGGHFNPDNKMHGSPEGSMRHAGDLGNVDANKEGIAHLEYIDHDISFEGPHSIIGRSVIIHKHADDYKTQPTGNAGPREACGVIGIMCK